MGKEDEKERIIKVAAPQHVGRSAPLVISFGNWEDELPRDVTIELVEIDKKGSSDDNLTTSKDLVASFTGTLVPSEDGKSVVFEGISLQMVASAARCSDRVWLRFASQSDADVVEAGIPFSAAVAGKKGKKGKKKKAKPEEFSANEGSFYELAARVREGHGPEGAEIVLSGATTVRQRAFVLLAVEPLSQNDSSMRHDIGKRILETYHPNQTKEHQPRNWGSCVIRIRNHWPMMIGVSGCSYVMVTMLLRYLRVDVATEIPEQAGEAALEPADPVAGKTARLWDTIIKYDELKVKTEYQPPWSIKDLNPDAEKWGEICKARYKAEKKAFVDHFDEAIEKEKELLEKKEPGGRNTLPSLKSIGRHFRKKTSGKDGIAIDEPPISVSIDPSSYFSNEAVSAQSFVPLLVWYLNMYDRREDGYTVRRRSLSQPMLMVAGESDYTELGPYDHKEWVPQYGVLPLMVGGEQMHILDMVQQGTPGTSASNGAAILVPLSNGLRKHFGLVSTAPHKLVKDYPADYPGDPELEPWQRFFVETLDRGLPIVGLFSPGQYSLRDSGGHFCMVVGYRFRADPEDSGKKEIRFILNDPAGGRTFQYEAHNERELNPEGVDPGAPIKGASYEDGKYKKSAMDRERSGLNLILERRKRLSIREVRVYEPGTGGSLWKPNAHARFLYFQGRLQDELD